MFCLSKINFILKADPKYGAELVNFPEQNLFLWSLLVSSKDKHIIH